MSCNVVFVSYRGVCVMSYHVVFVSWRVVFVSCCGVCVMSYHVVFVSWCVVCICLPGIQQHGNKNASLTKHLIQIV